MTPDDIIDPGPGSLSSYYAWFDSAPAGRKVQYYFGDLRFDRDPENHPVLNAEKRRELDALNSLADRILQDAREGFVNLFQRKHGDNLYEYIAVRQECRIDPLLKVLRDRARDRARERDTVQA